ncbi:MAG TPA: Ig-like domain-containing protein, partial [Longimicrobium sp.]|uniref:beta strand repeat-containing protein n=1 Tax=Longimicrobium sp. TaxID=2029185 RepID=UPI002ED916A1
MSFRIRALFLAGLLAAVSCSDAGNPAAPGTGGETPRPPTPGDALQALDCSLNLRAAQLECRPEGASAGGASGLIVGNQGVWVKLTGTNIQTIADTTAFDVTVQNLIPQALGVDATGAVDGTAGVRVFFHQMPYASGGTGTVEVANEDGSTTFLTEDRPYYQYAGGLDSGAVSLSKTWKLRSDPGVTNIAFKMYVAAQVRWPNGFLRLSPDTSVLNVAQKDTLSADVRNPVGTPQPDAVTFTSTDPAVVTVTQLPGRTAEITAVAKGTAWVKAVSDVHASRIDSTLVIVDNEPVATPDSVGALSNVTVPVDSAHGMLANDINDGQLQVLAGTVTTAKGGEAVLAANGSFTYLSRSGFAGRDTIHYSVTDGVRTVAGLALVDVQNSRYWYVRAGGTGDGRDSKPFGSVASAQDSAAAGDTLFVLAAGATDLNGAWVLENNQAVIGQGLPATFKRGLFNGDSLVVMAAGGAPGMTRTTAGATVTVAQNNRIEYVGITAANGAAITGSGFGTLNVAGVSTNPSGPALHLTNGTLNGAFLSLAAVGSSTQGVYLNNVGGSLTAMSGNLYLGTTGFEVVGGTAKIQFPGSIRGFQKAVKISGRTTDSVTFTGPVKDANDGVELHGNSGGVVIFADSLQLLGKGLNIHDNSGGAFRFNGVKEFTTTTNTAVSLATNTGAEISFGGGGLDIETTTGTGISGNSGGTFSVTGAGNTIITGSGTALSLTGVGTGSAGLSLYRIEVGAGAPSGIVLNGLSGRGVQVTGIAGMPGTAGFIHATTSHRVFLTNTGTAPVELGPIVMDGALAASTVAINASGADSIKFDATTIDVSGGAAISVFNSGLFGSLQQVRSTGSADNAVLMNGTKGTVTMPLDVSGAASTAIAVVGGSVNATFGGTATQANNAALLSVTGTHTGTLTFEAASTLGATNGSGLQFNDADGAYNFNGTTTLGGGNAGIDVLGGSTGTFSFGANTGITNPVGTALDISNGGAVTNVTYAGTISANAGRPVSVAGVSGGAVTVSGSITGTGQGISVASNTGGAISFTGATKSLTTTTNAAVTLSTNPGATITFSGGGLAISTTSGAGLTASGGGTVQVTGAGNTIASTTGTALSLASVTTGASGVNLASVSANGGFNGIVLSDLTGPGVQVNGGTIQATTGNAVSLTNLSALTTGVQLQNMTLTRTGATNMVLSGSSFGSLDLTGTTVTSTGAGRTIDLTTGSLSGTIAAINSSGSSGTPVTFTTVSGSATVNGGTITNGSLVGSLVVSGGSVSLDWRGSISQATNNVPLLKVSGGHTGTLTFQTGTLGATDGTGLQFDNADGTYNLNGTTTLAAGVDRGIDILNGSGGTFSFGSSVSVTNPVATAPALFVDASAPTVTFAGTISTNAARPVQIEDLTGGAVTVSGGITTTGLGILVQNNTSGAPAINFTGTTKSLNTGANAAVTLDNNDAATVNFSGGGLAIATTSGGGFTAINGGTVNVTGANNTVASTAGGTPVNIQNTSIGGSNVTFRSVNKSTGSGYGIRLENTGTSGGLKVTGDGTTANSGGTIVQSGATNTDSAAVTLSSTGNLSLQFMRLSITTGDGSSGITATDLTGTNLVQKSTVDFNNVAPAAVPLNPAYGARFVQNTNATITLDAVTMQNKLDGTTAGSLSAGGTGVVNFNVIDSSTGDGFGSTLQGLFGSGWVISSGDTGGSTGTVNAIVSDSRFQNAAANGTNNLEVGANASSTLNYKIKNNVFSAVANATFLAGIVTLKSFDGAVVGGNTAMDSIVGNTITNSGTGSAVTDRGYRGIHVFMQSTTAATHRVVIANNVITDLWQTAVALSPRSSATAHIKVVNNTIGTAALPVGQANFRAVLVEPQDGSALNLEMTGNNIYGAGTSDSNASLGLRVGTTTGTQTL